MNNDASSLEKQATSLRDQGKGLEAIEKYQQAKKLYQDSGDLVNAAGMQLMIGVSYKIEDDFDKAVAAYQQAIEDYKKSGDKLGPGRVARDLGIAYHNQGDLAEAEKQLLASKEVFEALPSDSDTNQSVDESVSRDSELGITLAKLAMVYVKQKKLDQAEELLMEGLKLIRQTGHPSHEITVLMHLAELYYTTEHYGHMLANAEAALGLIYEHKLAEQHARRLCELWAALAYGYMEHGNKATAKHFAKKSLDYINTLGEGAQQLLKRTVHADELEKLL